MNTFLKLYDSVRDKLVMLRPHAGIVAVLLALLFMLLIRPWTQHDTAVFSMGLIWDGGSPLLATVSPCLTYPLYWLHQIFPSVEFFSCALLCTYLIAVGLIAQSLFASRNTPIGNWGGAIILAYCIYLFGKNATIIYYAHVSYLGMAAAILALNDLPCALQRSRLRVALLLAFFTLSACIRFDACIGMLPFIAIFALSSLLHRHYHKLLVLILMGGICVALKFGSPELFITDLGKPGETYNIQKLNDRRIQFYDYPDCSGIDKSDAYTQLNITPNDLFSYSSSVFTDPRFADEEWLNAAVKVRQQGNTIRDISFSQIKTRVSKHGQKWGWYFFLFNNFFIILLALLGSNKCRCYALALTHTALSVYLITVLGRYAGAAPSSLFLCTNLFLLPELRALDTSNISRYRKILCGFLILSALFYSSRHFCGHLLKEFLSKAHREQYTTLIRNECAAHPENLYLISQNWHVNFLILPFSLRTEHYRLADNLYYWTGWGVWTPAHRIGLQHRYGESDVDKLLQFPNCYVIDILPKPGQAKRHPYVEITCTMFREHYHKNIRCVPVRKLSENIVLYQFREVMPDGTTAAEPVPSAQPRE
ncbi:MAG: hypothetical protein ACI4OS_03620 [Akkermansia sp.]